MKIANQSVSVGSDGSVGTVTISRNCLEEDSLVIDVPLGTSADMPNGPYQFKVGMQIEKVADDHVLLEMMLSSATFLLRGSLFKVDTTNLQGSMSGVNLEDECFFNETIDVSLSEFFLPSDSCIRITIGKCEHVFENEESPDILSLGTYRYTFIFSSDAKEIGSEDFFVLDNELQTIPLTTNKTPVRFATDEFNFKENTSAIITGLYVVI